VSGTHESRSLIQEQHTSPKKHYCSQSPQATENPAATLALALCEQLVWEASEVLATQYGISPQVLAITDLNSHASALQANYSVTSC
jgi:hypothetical protein